LSDSEKIPGLRGRTQLRPTLTGLRLAVLAFVAGTALAHDPFEITTAATVRGDALEVDVAMARSTALAIANGVKEAPTFDPAEFETLRARFLAAAPGLVIIKSGAVTLAPRRVEVALGRELDVEFRVTYPRPTADTLAVTAPHLTKLGEGYGNIVTVRDARAEVLVTKLLGATDASLVVALSSDATPARRRSFRYGLATAAALFAFVLLQWARQRRRPAPTTWVTHA
jgi:hypothetical protein